MSAPTWNRKVRIGLLGVSAATFVVAALAADVRDSGMEGPANAAPLSAQRHAKAGAKGVDHVEFERLKRQAAVPDRQRDAASVAAVAEAPTANGKDAATATPSRPDVVNAFATTSWYVPPPPPKPEPPPKPTAPPIPFAFMGRYEDASTASVVVMLIKGDRLYTVSEGDVIDDTYRIDRITERTVELTYLPLHTRQSLQTGGA